MVIDQRATFIAENHLHLDGRETGRTVGGLALVALETRFAPTAAQIIALCGLGTLEVTVTRWSTKAETDFTRQQCGRTNSPDPIFPSF